MVLKNLTFDLKTVLGTEAPILLSIDEKNIYENGEKTNKKYMAVTVTSAESNFEKVAVKVGSCDIALTNDAIADRTCALDFVRVNFINDKVKIYNIQGETKVSATADCVHLADTISDEMEIQM